MKEEAQFLKVFDARHRETSTDRVQPQRATTGYGGCSANGPSSQVPSEQP